MSRPRLVVCGGGLAGIAAACEGALQGAAVTLVERRPFLGGKAFSFRLGTRGPQIDNGQHVFLGCCSAYRWLLRTLGTEHLTTLQGRLHVPVRDRAGATGVLAASLLPPPLSIGPSFARYPHLSIREKRDVMVGIASLIKMTEEERHALDETSFADWLADRGQSPEAIERFWDLIVLPTCNDRSTRVSTTLAALVFREGLLRTRTGSAIGYARSGLGELVNPSVSRFLRRYGGTIMLDHGVLAADATGVVLSTGERLSADAVVLALPPERIAEVAPLPTIGQGLGSSPIVNIHLWYDRPVMRGPFLAVIDSPAQWVFNRSHLSDGPGQHLVISVSAATDDIDTPRERIADRYVAEMGELFPAARHAALERVHVVKEPLATISPAPGQAALRPPNHTAEAGLAIAGAWTDTGWPATMEGAVRSGLLAARAALGPSGTPSFGSRTISR